MPITIDFLKSLGVRELCYFYKYRFPNLSEEQQLYTLEYVMSRINEDDLDTQLRRPNIPGMRNCRRCSSKHYERTLSKEKKCKVCGQLKEKNKIKLFLGVVSDFVLQCMS